jgi:CRP/FNR family transcriptional regulator, cyclic AMP receptor protein
MSVILKGALRTCPFIDKLPEKDQEYLLSLSKLKAFNKGAVIHARRSRQDFFSIIESGKVKFTTYAEDGKEAIMFIASRPFWFGESTFLTGVGRCFGVVAVENTSIIEVPGSVLLDKVCHSPAASVSAIQELTRRVIIATQIIEDNNISNLYIRLIRRLLLQPGLYDKSFSNEAVLFYLSKENIASMLGTTRQAIHPHLKRLESLGFISLGYGSVTLLNPVKLKDYLSSLDGGGCQDDFF